jgi:hypothetical protein
MFWGQESKIDCRVVPGTMIPLFLSKYDVNGTVRLRYRQSEFKFAKKKDNLQEGFFRCKANFKTHLKSNSESGLMTGIRLLRSVKKEENG